MYKILLCVRYLKTRYIALASVISVMLGVATMIVVNSVMAGFGNEMKERIHAILADVVVESTSLDGTPDPERQKRFINSIVGNDVEAMTATVEVYGMMSFQYRGQWITRPISLIGVNPKEKDLVSPFRENIEGFLDIYQADPKTGERRLVRKALRSKSDPIDWKLTPEAIAYRKEWATQMERENRNRNSQQQHNPNNPFDELPKNNTKQNAGPKFEDDKKKESDAPAFESDRDQKNSTVPTQPFQNEPEINIDYSKPLEGRLYVGKGLISFPFEDPETGEVKTIMMVQPGDDVKISTVSAGRPPKAIHFNATVVDVFKSGMSEYDSNLVYCNLEFLQQMRGMFDRETGLKSVTSIQIKLKDYSHAEEVVNKLRAAFPPGMYSIKTWEQKQGPLLAAIEVESAILNVLLFLIIAVAGFGILAIFFMIVVEKTKDIGILKSLGASSRGIMSIFLAYGLGLGIVGSGVGVLLGLLFVFNINTISGWISMLTGRDVFPETIYYFPEIPTAISSVMVSWVATGAILIAVMASILPARRASKLHPVEALRYE